jgi:hypothetical protein
VGYLRAGFTLLALFTGVTPAAPSSPSVTPVLAQHADPSTWTTTIAINTAALCPASAAPSFDLVTTSPDRVIKASGVTFSPLDPCRDPGPAITSVHLRFSSGKKPMAPPVLAEIVITPADLANQPAQVQVTVRRKVFAWQYFWLPAGCGLALTLALVLALMLTGLRDPYDVNAKVRGMAFWKKPMYAAGAWTFGGSWATNIVAVGTVIAALLTATGTVSQLLPGVDTARFGLLMSLAGGVTVAAPLVFGMVNYKFERIDPTTAGVSLITPPAGGDWTATIAAPAGAAVTLTSGADLPAGPEQADWPLAPIADLPGKVRVTFKPGASLSLPPAAVIAVACPGDGQHLGPALALPGGSDLIVFPGHNLKISAGEAGRRIAASIAASDVDAAATASSGYHLASDQVLTVPGGARISLLGHGTLTLPAQTLVTAPGREPRTARQLRRSSLTTKTTYPMPHTGQVIASLMWQLLVGAAVTLFGAGAELGLLAVLTFCLSSADALSRALCIAGTGVAAFVLLGYSFVSIRALADPRPGDTLAATPGTAFML